jgi:hypothetical protein
VRTRFSVRPDGPWGLHNLLQNGHCVIPARKVRPGRAADHSPSSSAAVVEEYSYTSTYHLGPTGPVTDHFTFYIYKYICTYIYVYTYKGKYDVCLYQGGLSLRHYLAKYSIDICELSGNAIFLHIIP